MRWPDCLAVLAGCAVLAGIGGAVVAGGDQLSDEAAERLPGNLREARALRLEAVERTIGLLADKDAVYRQRAQTRLRAYQRLEPTGTANLWFRAETRSDRLLLRAHMGRLLDRDFAELRILADERAAALRARDRARAEMTSSDPTRALVRSPALVRPVPGEVVAGFGTSRDRNGIELRSRGVRLAAGAGEPVVAVAGGEVMWSGVAAGAGGAILIEHPAGLSSFIAGLAEIAVDTGHTVEAGTRVGMASGPDIYLEIRLQSGTAGHPIDPKPLLVP